MNTKLEKNQKKNQFQRIYFSFNNHRILIIAATEYKNSTIRNNNMAKLNSFQVMECL